MNAETNPNPTFEQLIERWAHCERVLDALPPHEREEHFDMGTWGKKTACGTVACAAGHCGLDPWFIAQGFELKLTDGDYQISDVEPFFGQKGSNRIFLNTAPRSAEKVLGEVREYLGELRRVEKAIVDLRLPKLGTELPKHGGAFGGIVFAKNGTPDYLLIIGPEYDGRATWSAAKEWAAGLKVGDHNDFALPDRRDGDALFAQACSFFQPRWYWLSEQYADDSHLAWVQCFANGSQDDGRKASDNRARAVRRVPIQSFDHSVISESAS